MLLLRVLIVMAIIGLAALELWLFWQLGEREDRRRRRRRPHGSAVPPGIAPTSFSASGSARYGTRARAGSREG